MGTRGSRTEQPREEAIDAGSKVMLGVTVILAVMAIGAVHNVTMVVVAVCAASSLGLATMRRAPPRVPAPALLCVALAAYCLLQVVPLPISWLEAITAANADVWSRSLMPTGDAAPTFASISLEPSATGVEALRWLTYACVITVAADRAERDGTTFGATLVFASGVAVAGVTLAHSLAGANEVWGLYEPSFPAAAWRVGPLLNPNNLAGYLNLAAMAGVGLLLSRELRRLRLAVAVGLVCVLAVTVLSASRGGLALLPFGLVAMAVAVRRSHSGGARWQGAALAGVAVTAVVLASIAAPGDVWLELWDEGTEKLQMVGWVRPLIADHPWLGIGRGAFESTFPAYRPISGHVRFTHSETFPLHWAAEWGLPVTLAALAGFAWMFRPQGLRRLARRPGVGLYIGAVLLIVQNVADLALEVPGVVIALCVALGTICVRQHAGRQPHARRVAQALIASAVILAGVTLVWFRADLDTDRDRIRALLAATRKEKERDVAYVRSEIVAAMRRYPAEPYFPLAGASLAAVSGDPAVMPWLQRALERGSANGRTHLLLAQVLQKRGATNQALMELRLAVERDASLPAVAAPLAVRWTQSKDDLLRAVPDGAAGAPMLSQIARALEGEATDALKQALDVEALERDPSATESRVRVAESLMDALRSDGPMTCGTREDCTREVEHHATLLEEHDPKGSAALLVRARLLALQGHTESAAQLLAEGCRTVRDRYACHAARVTIAETSGAPRHELSAAIDDVLMESCANAHRCATAADWLGDVRMRRGEWLEALILYRRAAQEEPRPERWLRVARAAVEAGNDVEARRALQKVPEGTAGRQDVAARVDHPR